MTMTMMMTMVGCCCWTTTTATDCCYHGQYGRSCDVAISHLSITLFIGLNFLHFDPSLLNTTLTLSYNFFFFRMLFVGPITIVTGAAFASVIVTLISLSMGLSSDFDDDDGDKLLLSWSVWPFVRHRDIAPLDGLVTLPQHSSIAGDDNIVIIDARWHRF
jgi:hypothetical protein